jgi:hypothetical protein
VPPPAQRWSEPEWEQVAPGIECKLLATDTERHRVSMLVRLAPGARYPAHTPCGRRRAASPGWRVPHRRAQALAGRVQLRGAWGGRRARLERDGLHLPAPKIPFAEALRTRAAPIERSLVRAGRPHVGPKRRNDRRNRERRRPAEGVLSPRDHLGPIQKPTVVVLGV